ncbi:tripartite tricarboxylate transporter substrate binding protein [Pseudoroseomonas cervicalis]|uniref:Bug family tripartite tricarboxylate transporter substrate binding protein n=1 Tax=Teichococcus cervicalis TaxID=204525 RepID=UPI0027839F22|nr:tripartite tricarboxylate transporter substrate binding protein [Pseudoroseomonas cervicalis]MDQ1081899.1 tripartite-type tricarboxylate transporter receptor subunit TctC [Pseudoroseomonas cervicalis]
MSLSRRHFSVGLLGVPLLAAPGLVRAAAPGWKPSHPVRFVVPFPAGGATDVVARVLADHMTGTLGQPVVVENRTGSGGNIGMENVVRSAPDGHSIVMATTGTLTINPFLYKTMGFDPRQALAPISMAFSTDHVLVVNKALPVATAQELVALARSRPGQLAYGSAGSGSSTHMVAELFKLVAGLDIQHVPYRGSAPALNDTIAGNVQLMLDQLPSAIGQIQAGTVKVLAVTGARRNALLPEVPTMAEIGLPAAEASSWGAIMAPAGTPPAVLAGLNQAVLAALANGSVQERLAAAGADARSSSPEELRSYMDSESAKWSRVVTEGKITVN